MDSKTHGAVYWRLVSYSHSSKIRRFLFLAVILLFAYDVFKFGWVPRFLPPSTPDQVDSHGDQNAHSRFLPANEAKEYCDTYNLTVYPQRSRQRKVYDLMPVSTELDWLEIRMNELSPYVDYFVIVESATTFTNNPKPLHFKENFSRFSRFHHQILYHLVDLSHLEENSTWERETYTRNALLDLVFPSLLGPAQPSFNDVILVSDADEIPRPATITALRNCVFPERTTLRSRFFYYSFQWQHVGDEWHHPQATVYRGLENTIKPEDLRGGGGEDLWNASWHCSSCFSTVAEMATKIQSFSHTEYNQPEFREPSEVVRRVRSGLDLFDRGGELYDRVDVGPDIPEYMKMNRDRFSFMLDRDPENANFRDYPPP